MSDFVKLIGLDFGTTTSSAVVAAARLVRNAATGRTELGELREDFRSDMVFTPLDGDRVDVGRAGELLDAWLDAGDVRAEDLFGGGALRTGLTAQKDNAGALVALVRRRLDSAVIAAADDPCLESWLAFMGSCAGLSRAHPDQWFLNLDVGGGTTNLALGKGGEVLATGCLFVGARHVRVVPSTYEIVKLSRYARALFDRLGVRKGEGECLTPSEVEAVVAYYVGLLEAAAAGDPGPFQEPAAALHQQIPLRLPAGVSEVVVTLSGGVGELVYAHLLGKPLPATTYFGDLGVDVARRLLASPRWAGHFRDFVPAGGGRATVYGLLRHSTQISGNTLFLPRPELLPLPDLPVLGTVALASTDEQIHNLLDLAGRGARGGCLRAALDGHAPAAARDLARRLAALLRARRFPPDRTLVIVLEENLGKTFGQYLTEWGTLPLSAVVVDEVACRGARFVRVGGLRDQVVPVSFYGMT